MDEYACGKIRSGDRFLLCSDGVYKTLDGKRLKKLMDRSSKTPEQVCDSALETALANGETDNITAVAVFCRTSGRK